MLNVHDLERRWLKYKIKRLAPYILTVIIVFIASISTLIYYPFSTETTIHLKEVASVPQVIKTVPVQESLLVPDKAIEEVQALEIDVPQNTLYTRQKNSLVLKPSLHFMDNIEEGLDPYISDVNNDELTPQFVQSHTHSISQENIQEQRTVHTPSKTKKMLSITTQKNENDLKDVIRRFKKNKNPALSLFIAKRYYELKKYQKSYNYALMTNEINKEIEESWIIFSKSLVKLGQHELAIITLKAYLKTNKSSQAEILLTKIDAGTFR